VAGGSLANGVTFAGYTGELSLSGLTLGADILGFGGGAGVAANDIIDLTSLPFSAGVKVTGIEFVDAAVLTFSSGANHVTLSFGGTPNLSLSNDGSGGTLIKSVN
jgi:hypothetical protein